MITKTLTTAIAVTLGSGLFAQLQNNLLPPIGNVGVGTLFPASKLHVIGNSTFSGTFSLTGDATLNGTTTLSNLKLPSLNLTVNPAGVEILVHEPLTGVVTRLSSGMLKDLVYVEPAVPCITLTDGLGNPMPVYPTWSNGPSKLFVRCPDNVGVGIGTNNPTAKLDVEGSIRSHSLSIGIVPANALARVHIYHAAPPNSTGNILLIENNVGRLLQLDNKGLLRAREIKLDVSQTWPDYVFDTDYKLMTPEEIQAFISKFHHLPGVPSAAEMEQNGMDVMGMNAILLKKIEELTLLLLQQQEQINALTNEIRH